LFNKTQTILVQCPGGIAGNYGVPEGTSSIGLGAFEYCTSLRSVVIPASVISVDDGAFFGCSILTAVYFSGSAPSPGSNVFFDANQATVYYLPGTAGWGSTFGGRPTALWNPQVRTGDTRFGVRQNRFGFNVTGTPGIPLVVETCTDLAAQSWVPLQSCTLTNGLIYFSDPQWTNYPERFYRLRSP
jgi:hypothetical protein